MCSSDLIDALDLSITGWDEQIGLYPFPANLLFGRKLHFIATLAVPAQQASLDTAAADRKVA